MPFDAHGGFQLPHSWTADKARGIGADAARFDQQEADIATAIAQLRARVDAIMSSTFNPAAYYSRTQIDGLLQLKQDRLNFTPVSVAAIGVTIPPLVNGVVPDQYLPPAQQQNGGRIVSINGRAPDGAGNLNLAGSDVISALGYTPDQPGSTRDMAQVTGLAAVLAGKQPTIGYTPANQSSLDSLVGDVALKQDKLINPVTFSASQTATEVELPAGSVVLVNTTGVTNVKKRQVFQIYIGLLDTDPYNLANAGAQLSGTWACCGVLSGNIAAFQRIT